MENILYDLVADKQIKRQIEIIQCFMNVDEKIEFSTVQATVDVSTKTIHSDFDILDQKYSDFITVESNLHLVRLNDRVPDGKKLTIAALIRDSLSIRILEYAYNGPVVTLEDLAKILYTSLSTLKNRIKHMNRSLGRYQCKLSTYNSLFIGSESNVRFFYFVFYNELKALDNDIFESSAIHTEAFKALQEKLVPYRQSRIKFNYFEVQLWIQIAVDRYQGGHSVAIYSGLKQEVIHTPLYLDFKEAFSRILMTHYQLEQVHDDEFVWLYIVSHESIDYAAQPLSATSNFHDTVDPAVNEAIQRIIDNAIERLAVEPSLHDRFRTVHRDFFLNTYTLGKLSPIFQSLVTSVKDYVKDNLGAEYEVWYDLVATDYNLATYMHLLYPDDLSCKLALISAQFVEVGKHANKRILFSFAGETGISAYLETVVRDQFASVYDIHFINNELVDADVVARFNPDVIVCNYNLPEIGGFKNVIRVNHLPDAHDWARLALYFADERLP